MAINYTDYTQQEYTDAIIELITYIEGHETRVRDIGDTKATIGYGYTFNRSNNVVLWTAAGITLTATEWQVLQQIDSAPASQKTNIALTQFTRQISHTEAQELLRQTYSRYEGPANELNMPLSPERVTFVSVTYNRGAGRVRSTMSDFYQAIRNGDRAEAWFQIRYNALGNQNPTFVNGIAKRRYLESQIFGLYNDPDNVDAQETYSVFKMFQRHRTEIADHEARFGVRFDDINGTRNMINEGNNDVNYHLVFDYFELDRIETIRQSLNHGKSTLLADLRYRYGEFSDIATRLQDDLITSTSIYLNPAKSTDANRSYAFDALPYETGTYATAGSNDLMIGLDQTDTMYGRKGDDILLGEGGNDILNGNEGNDLLYGGEGDDRFWGGTGNDILIGGSGNDTLYGGQGDDTYVFNKGFGNDIINEEQGVDTVQFNVNQNDLEFVISGIPGDNGLLIRIKETGETLRIRNWFTGDQYKVESFIFIDGTLNTAQIESIAITSGITGSNYSDALFAPFAAALSGRGGNDWLYGSNNNDTLYGNEDNDSLYGNYGDDALYGGDGNDILDGGTGDDYLEGGKGDDVYIISSGNDAIGESPLDHMGNPYYYSDGYDTVKLTGINQADMEYSISGFQGDNGLLLKNINTGETLRIRGWFAGNDWRIEKFEFDDAPNVSSSTIEAAAIATGVVGTENPVALYAPSNFSTTVLGLGGDDKLYGGNLNDAIYGGTGNVRAHMTSTMPGWRTSVQPMLPM